MTISMEWIFDPKVWAGLGMLTILELILGIDNLVFIAILSEKLPYPQRGRARVIGLILALVIRIILLASISYLTKLNYPIFYALCHTFSIRDFIMFFGGMFLIFKATFALKDLLKIKKSIKHKKLSNKCKTTATDDARFWIIVVQIVFLDAIFSLDSVITAIGILDQIVIMITAVIISIILIILISDSIIRFINSHPTVVIFCLIFLLSIGISLVTDSFGYSIPKQYFYYVIVVSIIIECIYQLYIKYNFRRINAIELIIKFLRQCPVIVIIVQLLSNKNKKNQESRYKN